MKKKSVKKLDAVGTSDSARRTKKCRGGLPDSGSRNHHRTTTTRVPSTMVMVISTVVMLSGQHQQRGPALGGQPAPTWRLDRMRTTTVPRMEEERRQVRREGANGAAV